MHLRHSLVPVVPLVCAWLASSCSPEKAPQPEPEPQDANALRAEDIGPTSDATVIGAEGGELSLEHDDVTYRLVVPAGVVTEDISITLTPARFVGVEGSVAARLAPDGTTFGGPVMLYVSPRPSGDLLALVDGTAPIETATPILAGESVGIPMTHFSTHGAAPVGSVPQSVLPQGPNAPAAASPTPGSAALAMGALFRSLVEPTLVDADKDVARFHVAFGAFVGWSAAFGQLLVTSRDEVKLPHTSGNPETLEELKARLENLLASAGGTVLARLVRPTCVPAAGDITTFDQWFTVPDEMAERISDLVGSRPPFEFCPDMHLTISGDSSLDENQADISIDLSFEFVAPDGSKATDPVEFEVDASAATGTRRHPSASGTVTGVVFTRALGASRPRVVHFEATARTVRTELLGLQPPVARFTVSESATNATLTAAASSVSSANERIRICAHLAVDNAPSPQTTARFTLTGPGSLASDVVTVPAAEACTEYIGPSPLPAQATTATVSALVSGPNVADLPTNDVVVTVANSSGLHVTLTATPNLLRSAGELSQLCVQVRADGVPVANFDVALALQGPGQLADLQLSVINPAGEGCTQYVAPTPFVDGATANITADVTANGASQRTTAAIQLRTQRVQLINLRGDPSGFLLGVCGGDPELHRFSVVVVDLATGIPVDGVDVLFEELPQSALPVDLGTGTTANGGFVTSTDVHLNVGHHVIRATSLEDGTVATLDYDVYVEGTCEPCGSTSCLRSRFDPPVITICGPGDLACEYGARCACSLEGCGIEGPYLVLDQNDQVIPGAAQFNCVNLN